MTNFNDEKYLQETRLCFAVTVLLMNALVLSVLCGTAWFLYSLVTQSNSLLFLVGAFPQN